MGRALGGVFFADGTNLCDTGSPRQLAEQNVLFKRHHLDRAERPLDDRAAKLFASYRIPVNGVGEHTPDWSYDRLLASPSDLESCLPSVPPNCGSSNPTCAVSEAWVPMRRPRVLVIATWYPSAGQPLVGSFFQEQAELLAMAWDVRVLVPLVQSTRDYWRKKIPADRLPLQPPPAFVAAARTSRFQSWSRQLDSQVDALERSLRGFAQEGWVPDAILAHTSAWAGVLATRVGAPAGIPVVIVEHSGFYQYPTEQRNVIKQALGDATIVCAVSPALRRLMLAFDLPNSIEWAIVGNLVDESVFYP